MGEKNKSVYLLFYIESLIESSTANFALKGIELEYTKWKMDSRRCFDRFDRRICGVQNPSKSVHAT